MNTLNGKVMVVTGASSGIGAAAARALSAAGATVAVVGRNAERTKAIALECAGNATPFVADMSSLASVAELAKQLAAAYPTIDVLANNAGFIADKRELTVDGIESTIAVNHVAPFLLTQLLEPNLRASKEARVITTSSAAHTTGRLDRPLDLTSKWSSWGAYGDSKLANIAFTTELERRMADTNISAHCFHPGVVHTGFGRDKGMLAFFQETLGRFVLITPEKGADTLVFLASDPEPLKNPGKFWVKRKVKTTSPAGSDTAAATLFWTQTEALVAKYR